MSELDRIDARAEHFKERLVSATALTGASTAAALAVNAWHGYFWLVSVGAAGWALVELVELMFAEDDRRLTVDRLVLAGSRDARCAR